MAVDKARLITFQGMIGGLDARGYDAIFEFGDCIKKGMAGMFSSLWISCKWL